MIDYNFTDGYEIYRRTTPGIFTLTDRIDMVVTPSAPSYDYVDFGALPGQTYYYAVLLLHFFGSGYVRLPYPATVNGTACCPVDNSTNLWVNYGYPAAQLAQWLMGTNPVTVQNANYTGASPAIGIFGNGDGVGLGGHSFPFDTGVVLSSGRIAVAIGPNDDWGTGTSFYHNIYNGDPDLEDLVGSNGTADAAVLEFDIVATNSFTLTFEYVYASEEYPDYIGEFNDPMAIFVTTNRVGTNWIITSSNNIALVPETSLPVSVFTVNGGRNPDILATNPQYYVDNADPFTSSMPEYAASVPVYNLQYDGFTTNLIAEINITTGVTNHVKIAVADYYDYILDSAVFLKAQVIPCP